MKEEINLLPPEAKKERRHRLYGKRLWLLGFRAVIATGFVWAALGVVLWLTIMMDRETTRKLLAEGDNGGAIVQEVRSVNQRLGAIEMKVERRQVWSDRVRDVVAVLPAEARIERLEVRSGALALEITGRTTSRSAVVDMQDKLEALEWVKRLEAPLQNFATGSGGEFSFTCFLEEDDASESG